MTDVVLLRSCDEPDAYVDAFREAGMLAECVPVLAFSYPNQDAVKHLLLDAAAHAALVVTSPRAVRALADVLDSVPEPVAEVWKQRPAYAVGPKTAGRLREAGFQPVGEQAGGAEALVRVIASEAPPGPLFFLCGNRRRDTLPNGLREAGIEVTEQVVYETQTRDDVSVPDGATWLVFFSPSGIEGVRKSDGVDASRYRRAAIGTTTAAALSRAGLPAEAVADRPAPEPLVRAITEASAPTSGGTASA